jgi:aspartyl-tRNA(Asn)/glutamyl-tRNA(Gln) amidotransferase subunit C
LARLDLSDQEIDRMTADLDAILGYVAALGDLDTSAVEPMTHAVPFDCPLRPDQVAPSLPVDEALRNAPRREGSFFQVPRIIAPVGAGGAGGAGGGEGPP